MTKRLPITPPQDRLMSTPSTPMSFLQRPRPARRLIGATWKDFYLPRSATKQSRLLPTFEPSTPRHSPCSGSYRRGMRSPLTPGGWKCWARTR